MGRLSLALRALRGNLETELQSALVQVIGSITQNPTKRGVEETLKAYSTAPWLRAASSRVADAVSSVRWELFTAQRGGKAVRERAFQTAPHDERIRIKSKLKQAGELRMIEEHPLLDLFDKGSPILNGKAARKVTQIHMDLAGEAFWLLNRNGLRKPATFFPLSPAWIADTPKPRRNSYLVRFQGAPEQEVAAEDVLWFKDPDPHDPLGRGSGVGRSLGTEIDTDEFAAEYVRNFFLNDAKPPIVVWGKNLKPDQVPRLESKWLEKTGGVKRAHVPLFMQGEVEIKELLQSFQSMQFVELRQHERDTILQVFGVPPEILGIVESSNRATAREAWKIFSKVVLMPRLETMRTCLQETLVPLFDERLVIDFVSPVPEDREFKLEAMRGAPWAHSVDEWRELAEAEPEGGEFGRTYFGPLNIVPIGSTAPENGMRSAAGVTKAPLLTGGNLWATGDEEYSAVHRAANRMVPEVAGAFVAAVDAVSRAVELEKVEDAFRTTSNQAVERSLELDALEDELGSRLEGKILRTVTLAGEEIANELPGLVRSFNGVVKDHEGFASFRFDGTNPRATQFAATRSAELVTLVSEETRLAIRQVIQDSFERGIAPRDAAKTLRDMIGVNAQQARSLAKLRASLIEQGIEGDALERRIARATEAMIRKRARLIARTETMQAANVGQDELWQQVGEAGLIDQTVTLREWIATPDDRTHLGCLVLDGVRVGFNESFQTERGPVRGPILHPGCRCTVSIVTEQTPE